MNWQDFFTGLGAMLVLVLPVIGKVMVEVIRARRQRDALSEAIESANGSAEPVREHLRRTLDGKDRAALGEVKRRSTERLKNEGLL